MKKAIYETRIRMHIDLKCGTGKEPESITMTAAAWNNVAVSYSECAERCASLNMFSLAQRYREIAKQITDTLDFRGYYDDL